VTRSEEISENLSLIQARIDSACGSSARSSKEVTLIAVTKNFPVGDAQILYELGVRDFGENRDQEGALKSELLPEDITWHFQGQLQSRKINSIASWADCIHSLSSIEHAKKFDSLLGAKEGKESKAREFLVQVNFESERSDRGGVDPLQIEHFLGELHNWTQIRPVGLMTVAPVHGDPANIFEELRAIQMKLVLSFPTLVNLSMGMSGDFESAIRCGATHIRIGSSILGSRVLPA
jgi:pyridoxal phosphate enzyme (YggS family)